MREIVRFTKMHGAGNDYIFVDNTQGVIRQPREMAIKWSNRHTGIGSDGLILVDKRNETTFGMRIFNSDGSEARMCGNGIRCVGQFIWEEGLSRDTVLRIDTLAGWRTLHLHMNEQGSLQSVSVSMGVPVWQDDTLFRGSEVSAHLSSLGDVSQSETYCVGGKMLNGIFVSMGNPHCVFFVPRVDEVDLEQLGRSLQRHPNFPNGVNVEIAEIRPDGKIRVRVWERGSGITMACGTGACAVAAAWNKEKRDSYTILMDGGELQICWDEKREQLILNGPVTTVFRGEINQV